MSSNIFLAMKHNDWILFLISRINYKVDRFLMNEFKNHGIEGISPSHGEILAALQMFGEIQMKDIPQIIDKDKSTVTALVNKLTGLGLIEKINHKTDKRASYIKLTEKCDSIREPLSLISEKLKEKAYANLTDDEKSVMSKLLIKINKSFQ